MAARPGYTQLRCRAGVASSVFIVLEALAVLALVAISLAGFMAAVAWTFAIWFGRRG